MINVEPEKKKKKKKMAEVFSGSYLLLPSMELFFPISSRGQTGLPSSILPCSSSLLLSSLSTATTSTHCITFTLCRVFLATNSVIVPFVRVSTALLALLTTPDFDEEEEEDDDDDDDDFDDPKP